MIKTIFITLLATTSIASACKISRAGMSAQLISHVTQETFKTMNAGSAIKAVYQDTVENNYIVEILDEKNECTVQLFDAKFNTLSCQVESTPVATFVDIPCK